MDVAKGLRETERSLPTMMMPRVDSRLLDQYEIEMICRQLDQFIVSCSHPPCNGREASNHHRGANSISAHVQLARTYNDRARTSDASASSKQSWVKDERGKKRKGKEVQGFCKRRGFGGLLGCGTGLGQVMDSIEATTRGTATGAKAKPLGGCGGRHLG